MSAILYLMPISIALALAALAAFIWSVKNNQYEDPSGDAERILDAADYPLKKPVTPPNKKC